MRRLARWRGRPLFAACLAAMLFSGCEAVPTEAERPALRTSAGADQDLREGLESNAGEGVRLAPERVAPNSGERSIYIVPPPPPSPRRREPTRSESVAVHRFVKGLVAAAAARDPALCTDFLAAQHLSKLFGASPERAVGACQHELAASEGRMILLKIDRIGVQYAGRFSVRFITRAGRKTKTHDVLIVPWGDGYRVYSGSTTVL